MKERTFYTAAILALGLVVALPTSDAMHPAFAPGPGVIPGGASFALDDGTAEIYAGSRSGGLVIANRFVPGPGATISSVSFYTSGAAAGEPAEIIIYEDPTGAITAPDRTMEISRLEVTLGAGGFQEIEIGELELNPRGGPKAAFFVGLANVSSGSFSLGIDRSGPGRSASFVSEDGGSRFVPISEFPVIDGNAMIRARGAGGLPFARTGKALRKAPFPPGRGGVPSGEKGSPYHIGASSSDARGGGTRDVQINDFIGASSGSDSCPGCSPALTPGYPSFTVGATDLYEDYVTIENTSGAGIDMPIRTVLATLTPEAVAGYNTDGGGGRPPTAYWEYSLFLNDGAETADNVLDPGEKITRFWQIANEGGATFTFWADVYQTEMATCPPWMVSYWRFDDGTAADSVGSHGGSLWGPPIPSPGRVGQALSFDGNDYIEILYSPGLLLQNEIAMEAWVYWGGASPQTIISNKKLINQNFGLSIGYGEASRLSMIVYKDRSGYGSTYTSWDYVPSNEWTHVAGTYVYGDYGSAHLYINGQEVSSGWREQQGPGPNGVHSDVRIGIEESDTGSFTRPFSGLIDEVGLYNQALTAEEILVHYNNGLSGAGYCEVTPAE